MSPTGQLPTDRQLGLLFFEGKAGYLAMMLWPHLDESSDGQQKEVFVAAGFAAEWHVWSSLSRTWKKRLKEHRLKYFKSSECRNLHGEFDKYKREFGLIEGKKKAAAIRDELEQIIRGNNEIVGFGMGVNMKDFWEVDATPEAQGSQRWNSDYKVRSFHLVIFSIVSTVVLNVPGRHQFAFVSDNDEGKAPVIAKAYSDFKKEYPELAKYMRGLSQLDDKLRPALQMADLMADVARRIVTRKIKEPTWKPVHSLGHRVLTIECWQKSAMLAQLRGQVRGFGTM